MLLAARRIHAVWLSGVFLVGFQGAPHGTAALAQAVTAPATQTGQVLVPKGTTVRGKLDQTLDSGKNQDNDTFTMTMAPGMFQNKALKGAKLEGHVEGVRPAAKFHKKGAMNLMFDDVRLPDGRVIPVQARLARLPKAKGHKLRTFGIIVGSAVAGRQLAKARGMRHGGTMGAAAGAAIALSMPGGNVVLKAGTPLEVKFTADVVE